MCDIVGRRERRVVIVIVIVIEINIEIGIRGETRRS